ncbi:hypothetical protein D3876_16585 [Sphingomonas cavernae]|uniref:Uncharacterized protein n=1 Tax=Sphingomonas cavernae TaxID=2320861 RepID=A0A418W6A0_9SPHN|nr:hypothetical protein D3876_16585 [Sphingomonas cavernae]
MGSYIASDDDAAFMVQITTIDDGRVNGSVSVVTSDENGKTKAVTRPMSGTIEGNALNLSVENGTGLSLVTGAVEGDNLRLTFFANGNSTQLNFAKRDAGKFEELANAKRHRAAEKQQEIETAAAVQDRVEQRAKIQKSIDRLADAVFTKAQEVQEKSRKMDVVIAGYRTAHDRAGRMQTAKRDMNLGSPESQYRVSQIDYQLDSLSNDVKGMHDQVRNYMQSLNGFMADAASQSPQLFAECQADELLNCSRLSAGLQTLRTRHQQFQAEYQRENAAFSSKRS